MNDIQCLYILNASGKTIFIYETYLQNTSEAHHALLSDFITGLQTFVTELGGSESKCIELGKSKIYSSLDTKNNLRFVLKVSKDANEKMINETLNRIKNLFIDKINQHLGFNEVNKAEIIKAFNEELKAVIKPETNLQRFLKSIKF